MKTKEIIYLIIFTLFFFSPGFSFSQGYAFFNASSKKAFTATAFPHSVHSLKFDSVITNGGDMTFYNFFNLGTDYIMGDSCPFWGGPQCTPQDAPTWIGRKVEYKSSGVYYFFNDSSDTLAFDMNTNIGDTSLFYKDNVQRFYLIYDKNDTISVFNNSDSAHFYRIWHTNASGIPISSALHQQKMVVANNWGLINFFEINEFPKKLHPLQLIGNVSPVGGFVEIREDMVYNYQPGDEIQYHSWTHCSGCPPFYYYNKRSYMKDVFISRTDKLDSVFYKVERHQFADTSTFESVDTIQLGFSKIVVIDSIPFEFYDGRERSLVYKSYCSQYFWTYETYRQNSTGYCPMDNCWGPKDVFGDPYSYRINYVLGVGLYNYNAWPLIFGPGATSSGTDIIYFKKNGIACGHQEVVGIEEFSRGDNNRLFVFPNPATENLQIIFNSSARAQNLITLHLCDITGRIVLKKTFSTVVGENKIEMDVSGVAEGVYFLNVNNQSNTVSESGVVKVLIE